MSLARKPSKLDNQGDVIRLDDMHGQPIGSVAAEEHSRVCAQAVALGADGRFHETQLDVVAIVEVHDLPAIEPVGPGVVVVVGERRRTFDEVGDLRQLSPRLGHGPVHDLGSGFGAGHGPKRALKAGSSPT